MNGMVKQSDGNRATGTHMYIETEQVDIVNNPYREIC